MTLVLGASSAIPGWPLRWLGPNPRIPHHDAFAISLIPQYALQHRRQFGLDFTCAHHGSNTSRNLAVGALRHV